jgi:MoxR-like ATPase
MGFPPERATEFSLRSWANTKDRSARTAPARQARRERLREEARALQGPDATDEVIERTADLLYRAKMREMAVKSAKSRKAAKAARKAEGEVTVR